MYGAHDLRSGRLERCGFALVGLANLILCISVDAHHLGPQPQLVGPVVRFPWIDLAADAELSVAVLMAIASVEVFQRAGNLQLSLEASISGGLHDACIAKM